MAIQVGEEAPEFELPSSELENDRPGKKIRLSDFRGKKNVVLAFYPLDFSPTCSKEHTCFRDDMSEFTKAGAQVIGVSVDSQWAHLAYKKHMNLDYPLVADFEPKGAMARKYGLYLADKGFTSRATVVVDKQGKVAMVQEHTLGEPRDNKAILKGLTALSEEEQGRCSAAFYPLPQLAFWFLPWRSAKTNSSRSLRPLRLPPPAATHADPAAAASSSSSSDRAHATSGCRRDGAGPRGARGGRQRRHASHPRAALRGPRLPRWLRQLHRRRVADAAGRRAE